MKTILTILTFIIGTTSAHAYGNSFCAGFEEGFKSGACDGKFGCIPPIPPICPIPNIGEQTFQDGYNRGFKLGLRSK
jgi:hypothetical protein